MTLTITQLRDQLNDLINEGAGDAVVIFEEEGEGYFTDDLDVNTLLMGENPTLTLLGAAREQPEQAAPHPDTTRFVLIPETHGQPVTVDLQEGDNLWIDVPDGDGSLTPRATSLFMDEGRMHFGYNTGTEWESLGSVAIHPANKNS